MADRYSGILKVRQSEQSERRAAEFSPPHMAGATSLTQSSVSAVASRGLATYMLLL
jgi:hypothetical protein